MYGLLIEDMIWGRLEAILSGNYVDVTEVIVEPAEQV